LLIIFNGQNSFKGYCTFTFVNVNFQNKTYPIIQKLQGDISLNIQTNSNVLNQQKLGVEAFIQLFRFSVLVYDEVEDKCSCKDSLENFQANPE